MTDNQLTWRANLAWHADRDVMFFGTVSTGFKPGGFNNGAATTALGQARVFRPDSVTNYEIGFKSQFANRALTLNLTAFRMDIDDFQERSLVGLISTIRSYCNAPLPPFRSGPAPASCPGAGPNIQNLARAPLSYSP